jgi:hypothetical protein
MFTNQDSASSYVSQSEVPARQRNPEAPDRRPTLAGRHASSGSSVFGGWGPRLG